MDTNSPGEPGGSTGQDWDGVGLPPGVAFLKHRFHLKGIRTSVVISVFRASGEDGFYAVTSHYIQVPGRMMPYTPSDYWFRSPDAAISTLETGILIQYNEAVKDGHVPDGSWLVNRLDYQRKRLGDQYPEP